MAAIFISHSSQDDAVAVDVRAWLASQGHRSLFLDFDPEFGIPAGRRWEHELYRQLRACRAVIVLCSRASMASRWCFAEITQASALGKVLLPVRLDDCTVDGVLSSRQVIDLRADRADGLDRLRQGLLAAGVDPKELLDWDGSRPPYPGLLAFQEADAAVYFGRAREIGTGMEVLHRVRRLGSPGAVVVVGASGSGKSSLVRAGLVPRLRRDVERWLVVDPFRARDDPAAELAAVWSHAFTAASEPRDIGTLTNQLRIAVEDPASANPLTTWTGELRRAAMRPEATVLVVVDQLEELILTMSRAGAGLVRRLREATDGSGGALVVLATLRSDFLGVFQQHPEVTGMEYELVPVGPMSVADIAQVIEGPARVAGLDLEAGLVQAMVDDTDTDDALPLLAFTLRELHDHFGTDGALEIAEYRQLGGLHGAVARVADELVESEHLTSDQEDQLRRAFVAMVRLTDDDRWVRQIARWDELPSAIQPVLENFVRSRLLVSAGDGATRTAEVAHEALFRSWDRLAEWLRQDAEAFRLRRDLDYAANAWGAAGHQPYDLWRGGRLDRTAELIGDGVLHPSGSSQNFIAAALAARQAELDAEEKARRRRLRLAAAVTVGALLLATVASAFFLQARRESDRAEREAQRTSALALAAQANDVTAENPALGLALAAEAARTTSRPFPQAVAALVRARIAMASRRGQPVGQPLQGHTGRVTAVAVSPDGELLASAGLDDGAVRLWDPASGEPVGEPLDGHTGRVTAVALSSDGKLLASSGGDNTVRLWDPANGQPVGEPLEGHTGEVTALAFSPDGNLLASAGGGDGAVRLWDPASGQPVGQPLQGHTGTVWSVEFSANGDLLASGGDDGTVRLWDPANGEQVGQPLHGHTGRVAGVAFSPDGELLASVGVDDSSVRLWDPANGQPVGQPLQGHIGRVVGVAFSRDGALLASAGGDGTLRLWDPANGLPVGQPLHGHTGEVTGVAFSSELLASAGEDGMVRLWDPASGEPVGQPPLQGHLGGVSGVAFSPNGALLASSGLDGTARLWDPTSGEPVGSPLQGNTWGLTGVAFSPNGALLASAGVDGTVPLWDLASGEPVGQPLEGHTGRVSGVAFSPDGALLASSGVDDGMVRLWDPAGGRPVGPTFQGNPWGLSGVAFSPDGALLASAGGDGTVQLWDPANGQPGGEALQGHSGVVLGVAFSPDSALLASAGFDGTVRLWDPASGQPVGEALQGHTGAVLGVAFSPDGALLASAGGDGTVRLWDPASGQPVGEALQGHTGAVIGVAFSPDGALLASAGEDGTLRLWDPADVDHACALAERYVTISQLRDYLSGGREPRACQLRAEPTR